MVPTWIDEGLTTYFESSKYDGHEFKINLINNNRLKLIQKLITEKKVSPLMDFIHIRQADFGVAEYAYAWSLAYFFINYNNGHYAGSLDAYFRVIRKKGFYPLLDKKPTTKNV
jgi:hypothetical protein